MHSHQMPLTQISQAEASAEQHQKPLEAARRQWAQPAESGMNRHCKQTEAPLSHAESAWELLLTLSAALTSQLSAAAVSD